MVSSPCQLFRMLTSILKKNSWMSCYFLGQSSLDERRTHNCLPLRCLSYMECFQVLFRGYQFLTDVLDGYYCPSGTCEVTWFIFFLYSVPTLFSYQTCWHHVRNMFWSKAFPASFLLPLRVVEVLCRTCLCTCMSMHVDAYREVDNIQLWNLSNNF